jgi:hypothetical protein
MKAQTISSIALTKRVTEGLSGRGQDIYWCAAIAATTAIVTLLLSAMLSFTITHLDVWYDTDSLFIFDLITDRWSQQHNRNNLHPLFPWLTYPITIVQTKILGVDKYYAALVVLILISSLWACLIYVAARLMSRPIAGSLIITAIALASTAGVLFLGIHERHIAGSASILLCIIAFLAYERRKISEHWLMLSAAGTLGITVTNFIVGVGALFLALGPKRGLQASINAFFIILLVSVAGQFLFPSSSLFFDLRYLPYSSTFQSVGGGILERSTAYWFHSVVMPEPTTALKPDNTRYLSLQLVSIANHKIAGYAALALWVILLGMAARRTYQVGPIEKVDILLAFSILGNYFLFLFFGSQTILYAPTYVPLMLLVVSRLFCAPSNRLSYATSVLFLSLLAWNNIHWLLSSVASANLLL